MQIKFELTKLHLLVASHLAVFLAGALALRLVAFPGV
jgi:hypothetical protein